MSRAMNLDVPEADVLASCEKHGKGISTIETLISGGTRLVMNNGDDAEFMRKLYKTKILEGQVTRERWR